MRESAVSIGFARTKRYVQHVRVLALLGFSIFSISLISVPGADASLTSFTWTGKSTTTEDWSALANWEGGTAPTTGETFETLTFPRLTSTACINEPAQHPCYISLNNVSGLSANSLQIDDANDYLIGGDEVTIGSEGINASPAAGASGSAGDVVETPFKLSASQTWHVTGRSGGGLGENGLLLAGNLTGPGNALSVELGNGPLFFLAENNVEVGPLTIAGSDTSKVAANGIVSILDSKLNATDGEPVTLSHVFFAGSGAMGPLTTSSTDLDVGSPDASIEVTSATFDSESYLEFNVTGEGAAARTDYSQLTSHGSIALANSKIEVVVRPPKEGSPCPTLTAGTTYTLLSTTGSLSGEFANAPEGGPEIPIRFAKSCSQIAKKLRISYHESGGTQTVTGTVEAATKEKQEQEAKEAREAREAKEHEEATNRLAEEHAKKVAEESAIAEVAARKKREEEAAAGATHLTQIGGAGNDAELPITGSVSLVGSALITQSSGETAVKLTCTGTGACSGKLTLTGKSLLTKGKKSKTQIIGTASFSLPPDTTATVQIKLDGAGRALLAADRGRLSATLTILKSFPAPAQTRTEHVRLTQQKTNGKAKK